MGGYFSHHIGCTRPDFRAVGPHSGSTHPFTPLLTKPAPNNAICEFSQGCPADGQVVFCKFQGMAHAWAGGPANYQGGFFNNSAYDSATDLAWTFFKNYAW